jgi:hypothetical protein
MRENIDILRVYNLVDSDGTKLQLRLGRYKGSEDYLPDKGFRWSFGGAKIPMPVRNATWFNGFPEATMLDWLKGNDWYVQTRVDMNTGKATIYNLPDADEYSKGNETYELSDVAIAQGERALRVAIKMLTDNGYKLNAVALHRYVHPSSLVEAKNAVDAILFDRQA